MIGHFVYIICCFTVINNDDFHSTSSRVFEIFLLKTVSLKFFKTNLLVDIFSDHYSYFKLYLFKIIDQMQIITSQLPTPPAPMGRFGPNNLEVQVLRGQKLDICQFFVQQTLELLLLKCHQVKFWPSFVLIKTNHFHQKNHKRFYTIKK